MINHPKKGRGLAHVTLFACAIEVKNAVNGGPLFLTLITVNASDAIH